MRATLLIGLLTGLLLWPTATVVRAQESPDVEGSANPLGAPMLPAGSATDTILLTEVLWYAVPARSGQTATVEVTLRGRPDGPIGEDTVLEVTLHDTQRQPIDGDTAGVDGRDDTGTVVGPLLLPSLDDGGAAADTLVSVTLRSPSSDATLADVGYRLVLTTTVTGTPDPLPVGTDAPAPSAAGTTPPATGSVDSGPADPRPGMPPPDLLGDLLPVALMALALGGVGGFELSRRGL